MYVFDIRRFEIAVEWAWYWIIFVHLILVSFGRNCFFEPQKFGSITVFTDYKEITRVIKLWSKISWFCFLASVLTGVRGIPKIFFHLRAVLQFVNLFIFLHIKCAVFETFWEILKMYKVVSKPFLSVNFQFFRNVKKRNNCPYFCI